MTIRHFAARAINAVLAPVGLELRPKSPGLRFLTGLDLQTVLDIGANTGQFAEQIRQYAPAATIHSFEPLPAAYATLRRRFRRDARMFAHPVALADVCGGATLFESETSSSSSLLPMTDRFLQAFPGLTQVAEHAVKTLTLDAWAADRRLTRNILVKMDVQGLEDRVIRGGLRTIRDARLLIVEVSFTQLYRGQCLFDDIYGLLRPVGFRCAGMINHNWDPRSGALLQADAIFVRRQADHLSGLDSAAGLPPGQAHPGSGRQDALTAGGDVLSAPMDDAA